MDPSGAGTCAQVQRSIDRYNEKNPPSPAAIRDSSQESLSKPVVENTDQDTGADCGLQPTEAELREQKAEELAGPPKEQRGWRKVIRNFTPS